MVDKDKVKYTLEVFTKPQEAVESIPENTMEQMSRRIIFDLNEGLYNKINIDKAKASVYKEVMPTADAKHVQPHFIKKVAFPLLKGQDIQGSNFEEYIQ